MNHDDYWPPFRHFKESEVARAQRCVKICHRAGLNAVGPALHRIGIPVGAGKMTGRALVGSDAAIIDQLTKEGCP